MRIVDLGTGSWDDGSGRWARSKILDWLLTSAGKGSSEGKPSERQ